MAWWLITSILFLSLLLSTITDIKKREIPIEMFLYLIIPLGIVEQILGLGPPLLEAVVSFMIWGLTYLILAAFFGGGGGDAIMMASLGLCLGWSMAPIVIIATLLLAGYHLSIRNRNRADEATEIPYAPFVLIGFIVERLLYLIFGVI